MFAVMRRHQGGDVLVACVKSADVSVDEFLQLEVRRLVPLNRKELVDYCRRELNAVRGQSGVPVDSMGREELVHHIAHHMINYVISHYYTTCI